MEKALSAYTTEHILRYIDDVRKGGLREHGFPRLTANIGILLAHGIRQDLKEIFIQMMDICCSAFLRKDIKSANEFSVREIICCIKELEESDAIDPDRILRWKDEISRINPEDCYDQIVKDKDDRLTNWPIFGAVSEYLRYSTGLKGDTDFVERQLSCQLKWLDENGMYKDDPNCNGHQPMMYDLVSRGLFTLLLHFGYRGRYYEAIDEAIKKAALATLKMQSPTGEIPFGGRSNQFLHNEPWLAAIFEYEAKRYKKEGDNDLAARFKSGALLALSATEEWLDKKPIRHVKNRFPTETKYGCERYAYFDKYMITAASFLYAAYLISDDSIEPSPVKNDKADVFMTTEAFHKIFLRSGEYMAEIDTDGDPKYDAKGIGRIHRAAAPSAICLSCPCPESPVYTVDIPSPVSLSLSSAVFDGDKILFGSERNARYEVTETGTEGECAFARLICIHSNGKAVNEHIKVDHKGISVSLEGKGEIGYTLPALQFDGEVFTEISYDTHTLSVSYLGWVCRYTTDGFITVTDTVAANRNGHYLAATAKGKDRLNVNIIIEKA